MIDTPRHVVVENPAAVTRERIRLFLRQRVAPVVVTLALAALAYMFVLRVPPGPVTYTLSCLSLLVIFVTAVVRANDIGPENTGFSWQIRRVALVMVAGAVVTVGLGPAVEGAPWPTWGEVALRGGFALTWMTTPNMRPWWRLILFHEEFIERRRTKRGPPQ